jgi:phosphoglycolate phosphatase-like HAD superfamily hydrolase
VRTRIFYWDIDGTLLTTTRAGVPALEDAVEAVTGRRPSLVEMATSGLTDRMIVRAVLEAMDADSADSVVDDVLRIYVDVLPGRLAQRRGWVMPGVVDLLDALSTRPDTVNLLLTGNMRGGASAKLSAYGLDHFFDDGGFGDDGFDRVDIAKHLLARAEDQWGSAAARGGVLIGDTPRDVAGARAGGLRAVAGATGAHPVEELAACDPWWVCDVLPSADELIARMDATVTEGVV